jgi:hypothetical protein
MTRYKFLFKSFLISGLLIIGVTQYAWAQYQYSNKPVLQIINNIEQKTTFRFLYRDALLSDIELSFNASETNLFSEFRTALAPYQLSLDVDSTRKQAIIYQKNAAEEKSRTITIRGQVVDAQTGERLPFATIRWQQQGTTKGTSTNESGAFSFSRTFNGQTIDITGSYVGYSPETIRLNLSDKNTIRELTFRLRPTRIDGNELIITGTNAYNDLDHNVTGLVNMGTFSPMGETNALRALQNLPSLSLAPALSDGLNIRGSTADGFKVLIDDITIYNQSHLFGLVDSFNADILKRSGFFYDIAPAQFQAPPGGTLSLLTKTGSLNRLSGSAGLSNTSARISLEGPIQKGESSWLISGRTSYMNTVDWFNNTALVEWGLNIDRNRSVLDNNLVDFESRLVTPNQADASFFDLHAKTYFETQSGNQFIVSGYWGGDDTRQQASRLYRSFSTNNSQNLEKRPVTTTNDWQNAAASIKYRHWFGDKIYSKTTFGASIYETSFLKKDFTYIDIKQAQGALQAFVFPFENRSILNEVKAEQQLQLRKKHWTGTAGGSYHYYLGEYFENSFERLGYFSSQSSHQLDTYLQLDYSGFEVLDIFGGLRLHYYSNGKFLKWSPRVKVTLFPDSDLSLSGGYSKNHQFLNKISLSNTVTSDIWILASNRQPPTSVNYFSTGIYYSPSDQLYLQAEAYHKEFENVRLHEINTFSLSNTFNNNPWYVRNNGLGKGLEFLMRNQFRYFTINQTFTLSEITLSNSEINGGDPFYADWDRTYRYTASAEINPITNFSLYLSWIYASGTPNKLATFGPQNEERLGNYHRTDISAEYRQSLGGAELTFSLSVYNLLNKENPWYRDLSFVIDQSSAQNQFRSVPVDVYDIGIQPSFNIGVKF